MAPILFFALLLAVQAPQTAPALRPSEPGRLQVYLAVSDTPDFLEEWEREPARKRAAIPRITEMPRGGTVSIGFIVTGYSLGKHRTPDLEVDVSVLYPDGKILFEQPAYAKVEVGPALAKGFLLANPALDLDFGEDDPLGTYGIIVVVHDRVAGKDAKGGHSLMLVEPREEPPEDYLEEE